MLISKLTLSAAKLHYFIKNSKQISSSLQKIEITKRPHHLTFGPATPVFIGVLEREVFCKDLTQHLTQQVTFSRKHNGFSLFTETI